MCAHERKLRHYNAFLHKNLPSPILLLAEKTDLSSFQKHSVGDQKMVRKVAKNLTHRVEKKEKFVTGIRDVWKIAYNDEIMHRQCKLGSRLSAKWTNKEVDVHEKKFP